MKSNVILEIQKEMDPFLDKTQRQQLLRVLRKVFHNFDIDTNVPCDLDNFGILNIFLSAKLVEGCSKKTINYYRSTLERMLKSIDKDVNNIQTDDLRVYLSDYKSKGNLSKTTVDNVRRILSSFFSWLEDEDYIMKNPVKRIKKIKQGRVVKDILTDENVENLRNCCDEIRDLAILELLISTGMRVGELVNLNRDDVDFNERECIVFGKGESERYVYFDARAKIHLTQYLDKRDDDNEALFVSLRKPHDRLGINGVERILKNLGDKANIENVHPHKLRRTLATNAIDKGMPIEQLQRLLGHMQIDTTLRYAMVNQSNVKNSHRKSTIHLKCHSYAC